MEVVMTHRVLVVDDEKAIRVSLEQALSSDQIEVLTAATGREALQVLRKSKPHLAILDIKLPDSDGVDLLRRFHKHRPGLTVIMLTAYSETYLVVQAMKAGAENYITKPFDVDQLRRMVQGQLENLDLKSQVQGLRAQEQRRQDEEKLVPSRNERMRQVLALMEKVSLSANTPVLIQGETGTGKRLLARRIHQASPRKAKPFLEANCAAPSAASVDHELFGSMPSGSTETARFKPGLLELAEGGSLYLDEISELPQASQVKLLRFLESGAFKRVSGTQDHTVDVRLVVGTNINLEVAVRERRFRQDLYQRLKVVQLDLPPLRERLEDILPLVNHYLADFAAQFRKGTLKFSEEATEKLVGYHWPGNVRELKNVVERAVLLSSNESLGCEHLPTEVLLASSLVNTPTLSPQVPLEDVEKRYILEVFTANKQNLSRTARVLGISRSTLREKLQRYGVAKAGSWR
jgi:DNA-binding NtrC family response regulator